MTENDHKASCGRASPLRCSGALGSLCQAGCGQNRSALSPARGKALFTTEREKCGPEQALMPPSLILQENREVKSQPVADLDTQEGVSFPQGLSTVVAWDVS